MNYLALEKELQDIDPAFTVVPNMNRRAVDGNPVGICNIFYQGKNYDLPPVPDEIGDEVDTAYRYTFSNGYAARFWTRPEVVERCKDFLKNLKTGKLDEDYE